MAAPLEELLESTELPIIFEQLSARVEKFVLRTGERTCVSEGVFGGGEIASEIVTGFAIPVRALFDDAENRRALDAIVRSAAERPPAAP